MAAPLPLVAFNRIEPSLSPVRPLVLESVVSGSPPDELSFPPVHLPAHGSPPWRRQASERWCANHSAGFSWGWLTALRLQRRPDLVRSPQSAVPLSSIHSRYSSAVLKPRYLAANKSGSAL